MRAGILGTIKPTDCLPGEFRKTFLGSGKIHHVHDVHYVAVPLTGKRSPYESGAKCFGDIRENTVTGGAGKAFFRVFFAMANDTAMGCPTIVPFSDVIYARAAAEYLRENYGRGKTGPLSAVPTRLKGLITFGVTFSRETAVRIACCLDDNNFGHLCLMTEAAAKDAINLICRPKKQKKGNGPDEAAREAQQHEIDELWDRTYGNFICELAAQDNTDWLAMAEQEEAQRDVEAEDEAEIMRRELELELFGDSPEPSGLELIRDMGARRLQLTAQEAELQLPAEGSQEERRLVGAIKALANDSAEYADAMAILGFEGQRFARLRQLVEQGPEPARHRARVPVVDRLLETRRCSAELPDSLEKVSVYCCPVPRNGHLDVFDAFMFVLVVRDPFWKADRALQEMIAEASSREESIQKQKLNAGRSAQGNIVRRYTYIENSEIAVMTKRLMAGDHSGTYTRHEVLTLTARRWSQIAAFVTPRNHLLELPRGADMCLGAPGNPLNFGALTTLQRAADMLPAGASDIRAIWRLDRDKVLHLPNSPDLIEIQRGDRPAFDGPDYNIAWRYFSWIHPTLMYPDLENGGLVSISLQEARQMDREDRAGRASILEAFDLEEGAAGCELFLDNMTGESGSSANMRPSGIVRYLDDNGHPALAVAPALGQALDAIPDMLKKEAPDSPWTCPCGFPIAASPELRATIKKVQETALDTFLRSMKASCPVEIKPIIEWIKNNSSKDGTPPVPFEPLLMRDPAVGMNYGQLLLRDAAEVAHVLEIPGDPANSHVLRIVGYSAHFIGEMMMLNVMYTGDPSGGKSEQVTRILTFYVVRGVVVRVDSQSAQAPNSGKSSHGPVYGDEADPALTAKKGDKSVSADQIRSWKQRLSENFEARAVCEYINVNGISVRLSRTYFSYCWNSRIYTCNETLERKGPLGARFLKLFLPVDSDRTLQIMKQATRGMTTEARKAKEHAKQQADWVYAATSCLLMMVSAKVLHKPVLKVVEEYGYHMMVYLKSVSADPQEGARLMIMFLVMCITETARWAIYAGFCVPGGPMYGKPMTWENIVYVWNLLGYCTKEIALGNWPVICSQVVRNNEIDVSGILKNMLVPDLDVSRIGNGLSGIYQYLVLPETIDPPALSCPPGYRPRKLLIVPATDPVPQQTNHVTPQLGAKQTTLDSYTVRGAQGGGSGSGAAAPQLVDLSYINTGLVMEDLVQKIRGKMEERGRILPVDVIRSSLNSLKETTVETIDSRLRADDFKVLRDSWKEQEGLIDAAQWLSTVIDHASDTVKISCAIIGPNNCVCIAFEAFQCIGSNVVLDCIRAVCHKGMHRPEKLVIAQGNLYDTMTTISFDEDEFTRLTEANGPWKMSPHGMTMGAATSVFLHSKSLRRADGAEVDDPDFMEKATSEYIADIAETLSSRPFREARDPPVPLVDAEGKAMDLTEAISYSAWNLGGCVPWTDGNGELVTNRPLTPLDLDRSYKDYMKRLPLARQTFLGDIQKSFVSRQCEEYMAGRAHRGTVEDHEFTQKIVTWSAPSAAPLLLSTSSVLNKGLTKDTYMPRDAPVARLAIAPAPAPDIFGERALSPPRPKKKIHHVSSALSLLERTVAAPPSSPPSPVPSSQTSPVPPASGYQYPVPPPLPSSRLLGAPGRPRSPATKEHKKKRDREGHKKRDKEGHKKSNAVLVLKKRKGAD